MKQKRREVEGRIFSHAEGLGTVTRQMIDERAREIAVIDGRSRPGREDQLRARKELLGVRGEQNGSEEVDEDYESLDPGNVPAEHGRHSPNFETDDEEQVQRDLVEQGIEEADHEQMLEGHYAQSDDEEGPEDAEEKSSEGSRGKKGRKAS